MHKFIYAYMYLNVIFIVYTGNPKVHEAIHMTWASSQGR